MSAAVNAKNTATGGSFVRPPIPPTSLPDYEHIQRFYDPRTEMVSAKILPGEFYVTTADELVTTLLGSCVAACIWDPIAKIGGLNHFMIPNAGPAASTEDKRESARYGLFAMEFLINSILRHGGQRHRLKAKLTGGGNVLQNPNSIGRDNVRFARDYLADEEIEFVSEHVEGNHARRVAFHPKSGRCRVQELAIKSTEIVQSEREYATAIKRESSRSGGDIELF